MAKRRQKKEKDREQDGSVFDDVYRTMVQKMPKFVIPLINEMFQSDYDVDVASEQLRNEHIEAAGKIITDSLFLIDGFLYRLECQSKEDKTMSLRMFRHDSQIAIERAEKAGDASYDVIFPFADVLYLRQNANTPDVLEVNVNFPDGQRVTYHARVLKLYTYTLEEIFDKGLFLLLPFYILRFEKERDRLEMDEERRNSFRAEYQRLIGQMERFFLPMGEEGLCSDLIGLMEKVADHVFRHHETMKKEVDEIIGGKILELNSERVKRLSEARGRRQGRAEEKEEMILSFLEHGASLDLIAASTGWTQEQILALKEKERA